MAPSFLPQQPSDSIDTALTGPLIVCHDIVGPEMAGPGIRYWEMTRALARLGLPALLAAPIGSAPPVTGASLRLYDPRSADVNALLADVNALVVTGPVLEQMPRLKEIGLPIVVDLYDPFLFENLHRFRDAPDEWAHYAGGIRTLAEQGRRGDFFICATERQRDHYLGMLSAWERVNPATYAADPTLRDLIDVVPYGLPDSPPARGPALRGIVEGFGDDARIVIWNGGVWDWFDPTTAVRGFAAAFREDSRLRLVFLGVRHPNPTIGEPAGVAALRREVEALGIGAAVLIREWTPYAERGAYLSDADLAISLHRDGIESRLAARTRLVDCIWAGLPTVCTSGDSIGDELASRGLAISVSPGDVAAVATAIHALSVPADRPEARAEQFARMRATLRWEVACAPLARFLRRPRRAADRRAAVDPGPGPSTANEAPSRSLRQRLGAAVRSRFN
jgi:glycosyltransferase involved in cell wall biosynthesis